MSPKLFSFRRSKPAPELPARSEDAWPRRLLLLAAAWNILGGANALLNPAGNLEQMLLAPTTLEDPALRFFFLCTWINVIAWGAGYLIAAFLPSSRAAILPAGAVGKLAYFAVSLGLALDGGRPGVLYAGIFDVLLAAGFITVLLRQARATRQDRASPAAHVRGGRPMARAGRVAA